MKILVQTSPERGVILSFLLFCDRENEMTIRRCGTNLDFTLCIGMKEYQDPDINMYRFLVP